MKTIGSQKRETLAESGMRILKRWSKKEVILTDDTGIEEVWYENDHFAGYVIEINGKGYEFLTVL